MIYDHVVQCESMRNNQPVRLHPYQPSFMTSDLCAQTVLKQKEWQQCELGKRLSSSISCLLLSACSTLQCFQFHFLYILWVAVLYFIKTKWQGFTSEEHLLLVLLIIFSLPPLNLNILKLGIETCSKSL